MAKYGKPLSDIKTTEIIRNKSQKKLFEWNKRTTKDFLLFMAVIWVTLFIINVISPDDMDKNGVLVIGSMGWIPYFIGRKAGREE